MASVNIGVAAVGEDVVGRAERIDWLLAAVSEAADKGAQIVVFPEGCLSHRTKEGMQAYEAGNFGITQARELEHPEIKRFRDAAHDASVTLLLCVEELDAGKIYNTVFFFGPDGALLGRYRKRFLPPGEENTFTPGEYMPPVQTPVGRIGALVCWEIHFPEVTLRHVLEGAEILVWTTMPFGDMPMGFANRIAARAADAAVPLVVATYAVPSEKSTTWDGVYCMAADAFGRVTGAAPQKPGVYVFETEPSAPIKMVPWGWPPEKWLEHIKDQRRKFGIVSGR